MKLHYLILLVTFRAEAFENKGNIGLQGEISLKILVPSEQQVRKRTKEHDDSGLLEEVELEVERQHIAGRAESAGRPGGAGRTAAPALECAYQPPEEGQVLALLGNMMNQLTKMFVRANEMLKSEGEGARREGEGARRKGDSRFKVVSQTNTHFFEDIYRKMTEQYLSFYNSTTLRAGSVGATGGAGGGADPCAHQQEMKAMWKELLDTSLATFRQAAFRCMDEELRAAGSGPESRARRRLERYLARELRRIRLGQLALLCDSFQLCYHELLRRNH